MTGKALPILIAIALSGCSSAGERAEDQYRMVEKANPTPTDLCDAARKVSDAYLQSGDEAKYGQWKNSSDITCMNARYGLESAGEDLLGDNLTAIDDR